MAWMSGWAVPQHMCSLAMYLILCVCVFLNGLALSKALVVKLLYLHIYQTGVVGILMLACAVLMVDFMFRRSRFLPKLKEPHEMPKAALFSVVSLTVCTVIGYSYFLVFDVAFKGCDGGHETVWLDTIYSVFMIIFCSISFVYILQRRYFGSLGTRLDGLGRKWVNVTFVIVWIEVIIYKTYLTCHKLCKWLPKDSDTFVWCKDKTHEYSCDPHNMTDTKKIYYYLNKGLLHSAFLTCAAEVFPVFLIAHWLCCGGAAVKAVEISSRNQAKQGVPALLKGLVSDIGRVTTGYIGHVRLQPTSKTKVCLNVLALLAAILMVARWFVFFYYSMVFDNSTITRHWKWNYWTELTANVVQLVLFVLTYVWAGYRLSSDRLDAHHKAYARGDIYILFGCCVVMLIKTVLRLIEFGFKVGDEYFFIDEAVVRVLSLIAVQAAQWLQYLSMRRLLALDDEDLLAAKRFLASIAVCAVLLNVIYFGSSYLESNLPFYENTLILSLLTHALYPADFLYAFTAGLCWIELVLRYIELGCFQVGPPLDVRPVMDRHQSNTSIITPIIALIQKRLSQPLTTENSSVTVPPSLIATAADTQTSPPP